MPCKGLFFFFLFSKTVTLILTDDLDFGTKERVLPKGIYICESSITYHSKAMADVKVFADRQIDRQMDRDMDKRMGKTRGP